MLRKKRQRNLSMDSSSKLTAEEITALVGGGLGAAISRGDGRWWAIPLGAVLGSRIGCEVEGG